MAILLMLQAQRNNYWKGIKITIRWIRQLFGNRG